MKKILKDSGKYIKLKKSVAKPKQILKNQWQTQKKSVERKEKRKYLDENSKRRHLLDVCLNETSEDVEGTFDFAGRAAAYVGH